MAEGESQALSPELLDPAGIPVLLAAERALVFLTVPWSMPERRARASFLRAAERLQAEHGESGARCVLLDEDAPAVASWLATIDIPCCPMGSGSLIWLERGRRVEYVLAGETMKPREIVEHTLARWNDTAGRRNEHRSRSPAAPAQDDTG
jgi:hypothetical protein